MKLPLNWLKQYVSFDWSSEQLVAANAMPVRQVESVQFCLA